MPLADEISSQIKAAMLAKDADRLGALRLLKSAIGYVAIEKKVDVLPDADVLAVIQKEVKKRRDSIAQYTQGNRADLAAIEQKELAVLETFLPKQLTPEELEALVRAAIAETGATSKKDMGAVMKAATAKAAGRADGKTLSGLVGKLLP
ncbi:MAG: GatB/YqeY domain-containing protein [Verrucomicrobia bacterium]|nr:GatB/YqeY domain-containing protein [Verrucomicrobiota bacterium]